MAPPVRPALKILMLHGYTQSGPFFHAKTRALEKAIQKAFPSSTLHYPTGPLPLRPSDLPGYTPTDSASASDSTSETENYGWWRRKDGSVVYTGLDNGLSRIADTIAAEGPFDGAIGFSQGGCAVALVASLLENGRREAFERHMASEGEEKLLFPESFVDSSTGAPIQPPFKFVAVYSGFAAPKEVYEPFYEPKIRTPSVHFIGGLDTVVEESRCRALVDTFENAKVFVHPGGHFLPSQKVWIEALLGFIAECCTDAKLEKKKPVSNGIATKGVEDMDVPF